ncbi:DUF2007 domain-containing protein [bacterium]|nr:DUF2007 domain-containing protein [bacterium]
MTEYIDYTAVLATSNPGDIAIIKSILDSGGITYFFQGENFNYLGYSSFVAPARLMVKKDQVEEAKEVLKGLKLSFDIINLPKNSEKSDKNSEED